MLQFRGSFYESPLVLCVIGEHFGPEWYFAGAPRRNVPILFGHYAYATTKQDNEVRCRWTAWLRWSHAWHDEESYSLRMGPLRGKTCK